MQSPIYDYFIIGQGIAGSILAMQLIARGQSVLVIDNAHHNSASKVAAGMINPVTGHRLNITEAFHTYIHSAKQFYSELKQTLEQQFFFNLEQFRLIKSSDQLEYWFKRNEQEAYKDILSGLHEQHDFFTNSTHGIAKVKQSAFIDTPGILACVKSYLIELGCYKQQQLDYSTIEVSDALVSIQLSETLHAKQIIFCEGYQAIDNPWFKNLPFKLAKGEILTLQNTTAWQNALFTWGNWLTPNKQGQWRLGSNFIWNNTEHTADEKTKAALLSSVKNHTTIETNVIKHDVGIRPSTKHRKPFVGRSSEQKHVLCFNGFGSKGCLIIPYYAEQLCDHLLNKKPLSSEINQWL